MGLLRVGYVSDKKILRLADRTFCLQVLFFVFAISKLNLKPVSSMSSHSPMEIHSSSYDFNTDDGKKLVGKQWSGSRECQAHIIMVHGYGGHMTRYAHVSEYLALAGFSVHAYDQRGFGRSEGTRAYVDRFDEYVGDLNLFFRMVKDKAGNKPVFIMAHSMGGTVAVLHELAYKPQIRGLVLTGPALHLSIPYLSVLVPLSKFVGNVLPKMPTLNLPRKYITRNSEVLQEYKKDPLVFQSPTLAKTGSELVHAILRAESQLEFLEVPLLILHGLGDKITNPKGSQILYERAKSEDKTLKLYPGLYHELLNEPEKEEIIEEIKLWLQARI